MKITYNSVKQKLLMLDTNKTYGHDKSHPMVLKSFVAQFAVPLALIFEKSLETGKVPSSWLKANVTPIFKKGSRLQPSNYRPVSLTSIPCKIMESIVRDHIMKHLIDNNLLRKNQHGFVPRKACVTNLLETYDFIT